jgi:hypothetical protein
MGDPSAEMHERSASRAPAWTVIDHDISATPRLTCVSLTWVSCSVSRELDRHERSARVRARLRAAYGVEEERAMRGRRRERSPCASSAPSRSSRVPRRLRRSTRWHGPAAAAAVAAAALIDPAAGAAPRARSAVRVRGPGPRGGLAALVCGWVCGWVRGWVCRWAGGWASRPLHSGGAGGGATPTHGRPASCGVG